MTNLEQRLEELKAEMELCRAAMKMQGQIDQIKGEGVNDMRHARTLIRMFSDLKNTFRFAMPKNGCIPAYWKEWVQEWNLYCYRHNKDRYILYVRNN